MGNSTRELGGIAVLTLAASTGLRAHNNNSWFTVYGTTW